MLAISVTKGPNNSHDQNDDTPMNGIASDVGGSCSSSTSSRILKATNIETPARTSQYRNCNRNLKVFDLSTYRVYSICILFHFERSFIHGRCSSSCSENKKSLFIPLRTYAVQAAVG